MAFSFTRFTNVKGLLTKRFSVDADGKICKDPEALMGSGFAQVVHCEDMFDLWGALTSLEQNQAIGLGVPGERTDWRLSSTIISKSVREFEWDHRKDRSVSKPHKHKIARSKNDFEFWHGPGLLLWDYDTDRMPQTVADRVRELGGPTEAFFSIWPEARTAPHLLRGSSSAGVRTRDGSSALTGGLHGLVLVDNVADSPAIQNTLHMRAWAQGLGWYKLSENGKPLQRSIIDQYVGSPERLVFEATPQFDNGLIRLPPPEVLNNKGEPAPTLVLDAETQARAEAAIAAAKEAIKPEADRVRAAWREKQADKIVKKTKETKANALRQVDELLRGDTLGPDIVLETKDGVVTVREILDNPRKWDGRAIPDPIEGREYGTRNATIFSLRRPDYPNDHECIVSHAHGWTKVYRLSAGPLVLPPAAELPDGKVETLRRSLVSAPPETALSVAVAVAHKRMSRTPISDTTDSVVAFINTHLQEPLTDREEAAIRRRLDENQKARRADALVGTKVGSRARKRHDVHTVEGLAGLGERVSKDGVHIIKAPMGSGKTQHVGRAVAAWAKSMDYSMMAITPRVSLTAEASRRLDLPNYETATAGEVEHIAICLPSIAKTEWVRAMPKPDCLFIDEISQVLRFLADKFCGVKEATASMVYKRLVLLVRKARCVVVADADVDVRTLQFLQKCRSGEQFSIYEMPDKTAGKSAIVLDKLRAAEGELIEELEKGKKVWGAFESKENAAKVAKQASDLGYKVLLITANDKFTDEARAFLDDPEGQSRLYDAVISSPAISSGLSIEHMGAPHFDIGFFIGGGSAILPTDAMQQMGRVRYLKRFVVGVCVNNRTGGVDAGMLKRGVLEAAKWADLDPDWTNYDTFASRSEEDADAAKADFAARLVWLMQSRGWDVQVFQVGPHKGQDALERTKAELKVERIEALIDAEPMSEREYKRAMRRGADMDAETRLRCDRYELCCDMGTNEPDQRDVAFWNEGHGMPKLKRFEDLIGAEVDRDEGDDRNALVHSEKRNGRLRVFAEIFRGTPLGLAVREGRLHEHLSNINELVLKPQHLNRILDRLLANGDAGAAMGIVGDKYRLKSRGGASGGWRPNSAAAEVKGVLERCGLDCEIERKRLSHFDTVLVYTNRAKVGQKPRVKVVRIKSGSLAKMLNFIARRAQWRPPRNSAADDFQAVDDLDEMETHLKSAAGA